VKAVFEAVACSAAAVPDAEPEEVGVSGSETPTLVGATEDALLTGVGDGVRDVDAEDTEAGTDADTAVEVVGTVTEVVDTVTEVVGTVAKVVGTVAEVVGMEAEVGGTEATDNDADDGEADIETDDDGTTVAAGVGLLELGDDVGKVIEDDGRVWDVDIDGEGVPEPTELGMAVETVQVLTSRTASFP